MTITIADGRGALWQWDTGRRVRITDGDGVKQIHYQNKCFGRSVDVDVGADGTAIIPDELLQDWHPLTAYAYVTDGTGGYTKVQQDFIVHRRAKPAGYVYTPTDQLTLQAIQRQIGDLADLTTEAKENLVAAINEAAASGGSESIGLRVADGYIQYSTDSGSTWQNLIAVADLKGADGSQGPKGEPGAKGEPGEKGDTGAQGVKGDTGPAGPQGPAGVPGKDGAKGDPGTPGKDGHSPVVTATKSGKTTTISVDGSVIATIDDGADGAPGKDGADGKPGVAGAPGKDGTNGSPGADGITPHIGDNGNWYLGTTDTGKPSRGATGAPGKDGSDATVTAANIAGALGYTPAAPGDIPVVPTAEISANTAARHSHANKGVLDGITDAKTAAWDAKAGTAVATTSANGLMSKADKAKLDGIKAGAALPSVTAADNGKILRVVGGAWAAASLPVYNGGVS